MKKILYVAAFMLSFLSFGLQPSFAKEKEELTTEQKAKLDSIETRVEEIKHMDKSNLTKAEKKQLKKDLRTMKKEAKSIMHGGVYLSITAIIIIILLLIIIL